MRKTVLLIISLVLGGASITAGKDSSRAEKEKQKGGSPRVQPTRESWSWRFGGLKYDRVKSVQQTGDGGFILAGDTRSFRSGKTQAKDLSDVWVVKVDSAGGVTWQRTYKGAKAERCATIVTAAGGGYLLAGTTESFGAGGTDAWVLRLDESGGVVWQKTFGGAGGESVAAMTQTPDGSYIVVGDTDSFIPVHEHPKWTLPNPASRILWAFKIDGRGEILWQKSYLTDSYQCRAQAIAPAGDGSFILGGNCERFLWLLKVSGETGRPVPLETDGALSWSHAYSDPTRPRVLKKSKDEVVESSDLSLLPYDTTLAALARGEDGFVMTGGKVQTFGEGADLFDCFECEGWTSYWVARIDDKGDVGWARAMAEGVPGYSSPFSVTVVEEGYLVAGEVNALPLSTWIGMFNKYPRSHAALVRLDAAGELVWQKEIGGTKMHPKEDAGNPEIYAYPVSSGEYVVARTLYPVRGRSDEEFHFMKLYEEAHRNICAATGTEKATAKERVLSPKGMTLSSMRVIADSSNTQAQVKPSAFQVEATTARAEPTCN